MAPNLLFIFIMDVAIIKNTHKENPGLFESIFNSVGVSYKTFDLDEGDSLPEENSFKGLIVLGGPDSANDQTPKILSELKFIRSVIEKGIPYIGICLGLQLMVKAFGGKVLRSPYKEIGLRDPENNLFKVKLTEAGKTHPLLRDFPIEFPVVQLHQEMVSFKEKFLLLGTGKWCKYQIVGYKEKAIGFQGHLEIDPPMFEYLIKEDEDLKKLNHIQLYQDYEKIKEEYLQIGNNLVKNFINIIET